MIKNLALIACVSQDGGLGKDNQLLWVFPADQRFFRQTTMGHPVVMGGNTFASIGRALPGRENIVLSRGEVKTDGVKWFNDKSQLDAYLADLAGEKFIIGGASLYQLYLPEAEVLYLTEIASQKPADVYFPKFERQNYNAEVLQQGEIDGVKYRMIKYTRK